MRRMLVLLFVAGVPAFVGVESSEAHFRWRRRPCPPCPCPGVAVSPPCPAVVSPPYSEPAAPAEYFISPRGKAYRITISREPAYAFERRAVFPPDSAPPGRDDYIGHDRKAAKTSIAAGAPKRYAALGDLLDELQRDFPDDRMRNRSPRISKAEDSDRVAEEKRNVTVTAWLYAAKKEANDNDFHLIIGTDPEASPIRYMNMEISGLPLGGPNRAKLRVPRQAFKDFLGQRQEAVGTTGYLRFEDPVPVRVTGSLLYDIDHAPGKVGSFQAPRRVPATAWEVHPITEIVFEP
jgi:hypothetical protein